MTAARPATWPPLQSAGPRCSTPSARRVRSAKPVALHRVAARPARLGARRARALALARPAARTRPASA
eukprot:11529236-Alexandrium_andersonii.AAC.1